MKLTTNQRRFLIVWGIFHAFALFVNVAGITWSVTSVNRINEEITTTDYYYFFTNDSSFKSGFWPFVDYVNNSNGIRLRIQDKFFGIFNSYDITEFVFYVILGVAIVYLPKLWKENEGKPAI